MSIKSEIMRKLMRLQPVNPDKDNIAPMLASAYFYTHMRKFADTRLKETYTSMSKENLIPDDDTLRESPGENRVLTTDHFAFISKVANPRQSFDKDAFINAVADKYSISRSDLRKLAEQSVKLSKTPLTKEVIEL